VVANKNYEYESEKGGRTNHSTALRREAEGRARHRSTEVKKHKREDSR